MGPWQLRHLPLLSSSEGLDMVLELVTVLESAMVLALDMVLVLVMELVSVMVLVSAMVLVSVMVSAMLLWVTLWLRFTLTRFPPTPTSTLWRTTTLELFDASETDD